MNGVQFATEAYHIGIQKKDQDRMGSIRGNDIFFRKSVSQTFNLFKLDFCSESPRFPFFCCFVATHNRQLGTHTNCVKGRPEAPGLKVLLLWTLNLSVYAHTCRQTKKYYDKTKRTSMNTGTQHGFTSHARDNN